MGPSISRNGHSRVDDGSVDVPYEFSHKDMIKIHKKNIFDDYVLFQVKGKGSSAQVYRAMQKNSKIERAVKVIRKKKETDGLGSQYMNEYTILKKLDHPSILKVFEVYEDSNKFYIVTELCAGGQLLDRILQKKGFTQVDACNYFSQIMSTINYLHENHFMHRDIKPQNLLLTDKSEKAMLKLIDFGAACYFQNSQIIERKRVGTSYYIAPEVLQRRYNEKCDIWSCGVILYILLSGETPFNGRDDNEIIKNVSEGDYNFSNKIWKTISSEAKDLVCLMLEMNPKKRISAREVMKHQWFTKFNKQTKGSIILDDCLNNIRNYSSLKKIQEGILIFIVNFLTTNQQHQKVMKAFRQIDTNGDGIISREQMKKAFQNSDKHFIEDIAKFNAMFDKIDKDKSGFIDYSEFLMATMNIESALSEEKLDTAFKMMDRDGNGKITITELKNRLGSSIPQSSFSTLVKEFDKNKDGQISKQEFIQMMKRISLKTY